MPEWSRQKALRQSREAERRAGTFLPGSTEARHALAVARYWRERYRMDQRGVVPDDVPLTVRCVPDDPWFEAAVGLALERSWDFREQPGHDLLGRIETRLRDRYPAASIHPVESGPDGGRPMWIARREGPDGLDGAGASNGAAVKLEVRAFPRGDEGFRRRVSEVVQGVSGPDAASGRLLRDLVTSALRGDYPNVRIVEQDALAQEPGVIVLYAYRDGRAVAGSAENAGAD